MKFEQENLNQENKEENKEEKIEDNTVEEVVETIDKTALKKQENQALSSIREKIKNLVSNFKPEVVKSPSSQYEPDNESENNILFSENIGNTFNSLKKDNDKIILHIEDTTTGNNSEYELDSLDKIAEFKENENISEEMLKKAEELLNSKENNYES